MKVSNEIIAGKLIMQIQIFIDNSRISSLEGDTESHNDSIYWACKVRNIYWRNCARRVDVQIENAGNRNMCAKYMFRGTDKEGKNALCLWKIMDMFSRTELQKNMGCISRFITDSKILGEYLSQPRFRSEVWGTQKGVEVRVYDVVQAID